MAATVVTIAQQKGGAGKTTVAAQLAVTYLRTGKSVALLDIDPQRSLTHWYELRRESVGVEDESLLLREVSGWRISSELDRLRRSYDIVLIDSPPHAETDAKAAIRAGDLTLVPVQPSPVDLWATRATVELAAGEKKPVLLVLNRMPPRGRLADAVRGQLAGDNLEVARTSLGNRVAYAASLIEGRGVVESDPRTRAAEEIRALADEVMRVTA
ncbi:MAG: ParA family partition ATPase [Acetobacterales bacterium]